ncbi:MAG: hypothetical protein J1F17_01860, partial [Oscillospiraceae bacterium]|nr:hypothetical protein [Oscillospiraceae bacterium]
LENLHLLIVRFCMKAIESGIKSFNDFELELIRHEKSFIYHAPKEEISLNNLSIIPEEKCIYMCGISNLILDKIIKLGDIVLLPKNSNYLYFKIQQAYFYGLGIKNETNLDEKSIKIDENFPYYDLFFEYNKELKPVTVWDLDVILNFICYNRIVEPTAILENQPYWNVISKTFSFDYTAEFADYICNKIQKAFDIFVLIHSFNFESSSFPPFVGINKYGIRAAGVVVDNNECINNIPGRVFGQYSESLKPYTMGLSQISQALYGCFFDKHSNEVFCTNRNALHRLAQSLYFYDSTHLIIEVFNILDMLLPEELNSKKIINHISTFISKSKLEKSNISNELKSLKSTIRDPIVHSGKSVLDLGLQENDIIKVVNRLISIIITYCENVYLLGDISYKELKQEKQRILREFN